MKKLLFIFATVLCAQTPSEFTPTSGIVWTMNHSFGLGVEFQVKQSGWFTVDRVWPVQGTQGSISPTKVHITGGTINLYPAKGKPIATLVRIYAIGAGEPVLIFNQNLSAINEARTLEINPQDWILPAPAADGSLGLLVHIDTAGAGGTAGTEVELAGNWE